MKLISSNFDYSYTSLRLPPLVIGIASVFFIFYLRKKLYPTGSVFSYLFILILVSSQTFTDYLVQVKQYEMDIFLCLLALWQLMTLLKISNEGVNDNSRYLLLCFCFLVVPYFSYVYPITVAPIFPVVILSTIARLRNSDRSRIPSLLPLYLPLLIVTISIVIFYIIDVKNLMADKRMYLSYLEVYHKGKKPPFIQDFWNLFSLVGSGFIYEIIFGVLGIVSFFYGIYKLVKTKLFQLTNGDYINLYAVLLLCLVLCLFLSGKLIGGAARLTAYTVPSISMLIIFFFEDMKGKYKYARLANVLAGILFLGLFGNIITVGINSFTYPQYSHKIKTYWNTSKALTEARLHKVPILVTDGVLGEQIDVEAPAVPGKISTNTISPEQIAGADRLVPEVIVKVNPEYKVWDTIPVYFIPDVKWTEYYMKQLPEKFEAAIAGDGIFYQLLKR